MMLWQLVKSFIFMVLVVVNYNNPGWHLYNLTSFYKQKMNLLQELDWTHSLRHQ